MTRDAAARVHALLITASGAIDQSVAIAQADMDAHQLRESKRAAGNVLAALMDEAQAFNRQDSRHLQHPPEATPPQSCCAWRLVFAL